MSPSNGRRRCAGSSSTALTGDLTAPKAWLDAINQFQNELRSVNYVVLGPAQAGDIPQPTDEQLSKYFDERKILFRAPEYRKIDVVAVTPAELAKWMEISDDDIKSAYDKQQLALHHAGTPSHPADHLPQYGGRAGRRRPHQERHKLCRDRRRARA